MIPRRLPVHAGAAAVCAVVHDAYHVNRGAPLDVLWLCNLAVPLIALGCLLPSRRPIAIGLTWLGFGTPIWLLSLVTGANMVLTSPLVHVVAPLVAVDALRRVGWPARTWPRAFGGSLLVLLGTWLLGQRTGNVNLVFAIEHGWENTFHGSYAGFLGALLATSLAWAIAFDRLMTRVLGGTAAGAPKSLGATGE